MLLLTLFDFGNALGSPDKRLRRRVEFAAGSVSLCLRVNKYLLINNCCLLVTVIGLFDGNLVLMDEENEDGNGRLFLLPSLPSFNILLSTGVLSSFSKPKESLLTPLGLEFTFRVVVYQRGICLVEVLLDRGGG